MLPLLAIILTGLITDSEGAAIANATVEIVTPAGPTTRTSKTGQYRFPDLPTADVQLRVRAPGFTPHTGPAAPVIRLEINAQYFCCGCESTPPRYARKASSQSSLKGTFYAERLDNNGEATLTPRSGGTPIRLQLGLHRFEFPNLPPGRYALKITVPTYADFLIDDLEITPKTETRIDADIVLEDCPSWTAPCAPTRKLFYHKPTTTPMLCL